MHRIMLLVAVAALLAPTAATAKSGATTPPQVKALQAQVKTLQTQLKTQAHQITVLQSTLAQAAQAINTLNTNQTKLANVFGCTTAIELTIRCCEMKPGGPNSLKPPYSAPNIAV